MIPRAWLESPINETNYCADHQTAAIKKREDAVNESLSLLIPAVFGGSQASLLYPAINQGLALRWRHDQQQLQQQQFQQQLKQQQQLRSLHNQDMTGTGSD